MCQYTPDNKRTKNTNQTKMCAIMVFYVYFVLYIELLFGNVDLNGSLKIEKNPNVTIVNGAGEVLNYKCGNLSMISIEITPSKITHGLILATGIYTPVRSFYLSFITIDGHAVPLFLNFNGELSIYYPNQTVESPKRIDGSFAYICA